MTIYPAIDILDSKAVRLKEGRKHEVTIYGDPIEMAEKWISQGAEWLHVVDLDGAFEGVPKNLAILREMKAAVPKAKIQIGGGIRSMSTVESYLEAGIERVVLGTAAVQNHDLVKNVLGECPDNVAIGIDARDGKVQISGWTENSEISAVELAHKLEDLGTRLIIYTDISRDGVLRGPNVGATRDMIENTQLSLIAAGGVSSIEDVRQLAVIDHGRLEGVIIGKALYEGRIDLEEALDNAR
jgi:phosphoribosylformimino-5-aminoimidazole carboxamide ribotide isomerase